MKRLQTEYIAGGGLVNRRSILLGGISFLAASTIKPLTAAENEGTRRIGDDFPVWSKTLGRQGTTYGEPSAHEQHVKLKLQLPSAPENAGVAGWLTPLEEMHGIITPNGLHFGSHHFGIPDIDAENHELLIHGLVKKPLKFSVEHLLRYPMVSKIRFIECAGNTGANALSPLSTDGSCQDLYGLTSCAEWTGIRVSTLLNECSPGNRAKWVVVEGADGGSHSRSIPLSKLLDDAIIAFYQNGERLRAEQGYPMRLLVPGWEGNANIKYIHRMEVVDTPAYTAHESGTYTQHLSSGGIEGFAFHMDVKSVITHPSGKQLLAEKGFYEISGLAWSGYGKIAKVEVSADEGKTWAPAQIQGAPIAKALTRFSIPWQWDGNSTVLLSRATDEHGRTQPTRKEWKQRYASPTFNHYNAVQSWHVSSSGQVENVYV
jgi:sulfane dehydrogenase subunit SoxC